MQRSRRFPTGGIRFLIFPFHDFICEGKNILVPKGIILVFYHRKNVSADPMEDKLALFRQQVSLLTTSTI